MFDESPDPIVPTDTDENDEAASSTAESRFASCRWQQAAENGTAAHCTHGEVLPFAGTGGFSPEAWCLDCTYFKLRRTRRR
jgi:hypothetical protein